jgi:hypothetical protein
MNDSSNCAIALSELDELNRFYNNELNKLNEKVRLLFNEKFIKGHEFEIGGMKNRLGAPRIDGTYDLPSDYAVYNDITDDNITRLELEGAIVRIKFAKNMLELFKNKGNITTRLLTYVKMKLANGTAVGKSAEEDVKLFVSMFGQMPISPAIETFLIKVQQKQITTAEMTAMMSMVWPFIQGFEYDDAKKEKDKKLSIRTFITLIGNIAGYSSGFAYIGMWNKLSKLYKIASRMPSLMTMVFGGLSLVDWLGELHAANESYLLTPNSYICPSPKHESLTLDKDSASNALYRWRKQLEEYAETSVERKIAVLEVFKNTDKEFAEKYSKFLSIQETVNPNTPEESDFFGKRGGTQEQSLLNEYMRWKSMYYKDFGINAIADMGEFWRTRTFSFEKETDEKIKALYAYIHNSHTSEDIMLIKSISPGFDMDDDVLTYRQKRMKLVPILNAILAQETRFARIISNALDAKLLAEFIKRAREESGRVQVIEAEFRKTNVFVQSVVQQVVKKIKLIPFFVPTKIVAPVKIEVPDSTIRPGGAVLAAVIPEGSKVEATGVAGSIVEKSPDKVKIASEKAQTMFNRDILALKNALESKDDKGIAGENSRKFLVQNQVRIEQQIKDYQGGKSVLSVMTQTEIDTQPDNEISVGIGIDGNSEEKSYLTKIIDGAVDSVLKSVVQPIKLTAEQMAANQLTPKEKAFAKETGRSALDMFTLRMNARHGGEVSITILTKGDVLRAEDGEIAKAALEDINAKIAENKKAVEEQQKLIKSLEEAVNAQFKAEQDARDAETRRKEAELKAIGPWANSEFDAAESAYEIAIADINTQKSKLETDLYNNLPERLRKGKAADGGSRLVAEQRQDGIAKFEGKTPKKHEDDIRSPKIFPVGKRAEPGEVEKLGKSVDEARTEASHAKLELDNLIKDSGRSLAEEIKIYQDEFILRGGATSEESLAKEAAIKKYIKLNAKYQALLKKFNDAQGIIIAPIDNSGNDGGVPQAQGTRKDPKKEPQTPTAPKEPTGADYTTKYLGAYGAASEQEGEAVANIAFLKDAEKAALSTTEDFIVKNQIKATYQAMINEQIKLINEAQGFKDKWRSEYDKEFNERMKKEGVIKDYKDVKRTASNFKPDGDKFMRRQYEKKTGTWGGAKEKLYKQEEEKARKDDNKASAAYSKVYAWMQQHAGGREADKKDERARNIGTYGQGGQGGKQKSNGHSYGCKCKACTNLGKDAEEKLKKAIEDGIIREDASYQEYEAARKFIEEMATKAAQEAAERKKAEDERIKREAEKRLNTIIPNFGTLDEYYMGDDGFMHKKVYYSDSYHLLKPTPIYDFIPWPGDEIPVWPNGFKKTILSKNIVPTIHLAPIKPKLDNPFGPMVNIKSTVYENASHVKSIINKPENTDPNLLPPPPIEPELEGPDAEDKRFRKKHLTPDGINYGKNY